MRFLLYLLLFFIGYFIIKLVVRSLTSKPKTKIHSSGTGRKENRYENVEDAKFTEIKTDDEKKKNM